MAAPMTDLHIKHVIDMGIKVLRADPDRHLADIFCDANNDAHSALYGRRMIDQAKEWLLKNEIPVIFGFDINEAQMPCVTINLGQSVPRQQAIGDDGLPSSEPLKWQEKEVVLPKFVPESAVLSDDQRSMIIGFPKDMPFDQQSLFLPGLTVRDNSGREYGISIDKDFNPLIVQDSDEAPLKDIDLTGIEVLSPVINARYSRGVMVYDDTVSIAVHGHANRQEGMWLYYIVMWILLKFRAVLEGLFGLQLSTPMASDFQKDDLYLATHIWRRYITVTTTTAWTWESSRQKDILALALTIFGDRNGGPSDPVKL